MPVQPVLLHVADDADDNAPRLRVALRAGKLDALAERLSVGPEATTALMTAAVVAPLAAGSPARYAVLAAALAVVVGLLCLLALPNLALGLSGFEMSMILMPQVRGKPREEPPLTRIWNSPFRRASSPISSVT